MKIESMMCIRWNVLDKEDAQHLEEYRHYLKALRIRVETMENLIRPLAAQEKVEGELPEEIPDI